MEPLISEFLLLCSLCESKCFNLPITLLLIHLNFPTMGQ